MYCKSETQIQIAFHRTVEDSSYSTVSIILKARNDQQVIDGPSARQASLPPPQQASRSSIKLGGAPTKKSGGKRRRMLQARRRVVQAATSLLSRSFLNELGRPRTKSKTDANKLGLTFKGVVFKLVPPFCQKTSFLAPQQEALSARLKLLAPAD
jgi:hypothetical protein